MKTIKFLTYATFVLFLGFAISSCEGPAGADGSAGTAGTNGTNGTNGTDGTDGTDGNANVQTYVYTNPAWGSSYWMDIDMTGILTDGVIQNDVILGYVKSNGYTLINPIPGVVASSPHQYFYVNMFDSSTSSYAGTYRIVSRVLDGSSTPHASLQALDWVKIIIIDSSNTTTTAGNGRISPQQAIYNELAEAGVDVNDYNAVCAYYGINPE